MLTRTTVPGPTAALARFSAALRCEHLTSHDLRSVKRHLLDTLGAMIAGASSPPTRIAGGVLDEIEGRGDVPVPGHRQRRSRLWSAYLGGASAHGLELDDGYRAGSVHPGAPVIPAVLAAAWGNGIGGERAAAAIAVGYELVTRIAEAAHPGSRRRGFHNTSITGVLGAAGAVSSLLGLDEDRMEHALGIAASSAAGLFAFLQGGGEIKRLHPGFAAREGLFAALLVRDGMTGPRGVLEGRDGFLQAYSGADKLAALTADLDPSAGRGLNVGRCYLKPYACCRHIHPAIDGVIQIVAEEGLDPQAIGRIDAQTYGIAAEHAKGGWGDMASAQLSYQFCVATAARKGRVGIEEFRDEALHDPGTLALCERIAVEIGDEFERTYPQLRSAEVSVETGDGRRFKRFIDEPSGSARHPLDDDAVAAKFMSLAVPVIGDAAALRLHELVFDLENLASLDPLMAAAAAA